jgi:ribosomal protein S18 acetylase RimI-like enzyme
VIAEAQRSGQPFSLHVLKVNTRAISLYRRLGLTIVEEGPVKLSMRRDPVS